jgi:uncharacterized protein YbdZ (MbtH family)
MKFFIQRTFRPAIVGTILMAGAAGCGRDNVKVYHIESGDAAAPTPATPDAMPAAMPTTMPAGLPAPDNSSLPRLQYVLPAGWQEKTPTQMRVASFDISQDGKHADISVIPLGGMGGGDFANVNRWRGQVGLPPLADDALRALAEPVAVGDQPADLYDLAGTAPGSAGTKRILAVILHRDDTAWFFKMTGEDPLVAAQKEHFIQFLKSISFVENAPAQIAGTSLGNQNFLIPNANTVVMGGIVTNSDDHSIWTIPAGWQPSPPSEFLTAKFSIAGADGAAAQVNVSELAGEGGGVLANVNRWRGQLGQPPVTQEDDFSKMVGSIGLPHGLADIVDLSGTDAETGKPARLVGAIVPQNGQTWFYKLMGDGQIVAQQKDAFIQFIQSAKYPDAGNAP